MTINIDFFRSENEATLDGIEEYQKRMEEQLIVIKAMEEKKLLELARTLPLEEGEYYAERDGNYWTFEVMFPRSLRYSFLVLICMTLENQIKGLCSILKARRSLSTDMNINHSLFVNAKNYIETTANIPPIDPAHWERINDIRILRNCIVHAHGNVDEDKNPTRARNVATQFGGVSIGTRDFLDKGYLLLEPEACHQAVLDVKTFFSLLYNAAGFAPAVFWD